MAFNPRHLGMPLAGAIAALLIACVTHQPTATRTPEVTLTFHYPAAPRGEVVDDYHGMKVPDPYRWFEDLNADNTGEWVRAENALSQPYLEVLPQRAWLGNRL